MIIKSNTHTTIGTILLASGDSATFTTIRNNDEVVAQVDLIRSDNSMETYYIKQTGKGNLYMNKNLREKSNKE